LGVASRCLMPKGQTAGRYCLRPRCDEREKAGAQIIQSGTAGGQWGQMIGGFRPRSSNIPLTVILGPIPNCCKNWRPAKPRGQARCQLLRPGGRPAAADHCAEPANTSPGLRLRAQPRSDLNELVQRQRYRCSPIRTPRGANNRRDFSARSGPIPAVVADPNPTDAGVFLNLLLECGAGRSRGRARRKARFVFVSDANPTRVWIVVSDDGPGIAPEKSRHIFDPFHHPSVRGAGLGLGLSICKTVLREPWREYRSGPTASGWRGGWVHDYAAGRGPAGAGAAAK